MDTDKQLGLRARLAKAERLPPLARRGAVERVSRIWRPWEASVTSDAYGMVWARGWTRRQAVRRAVAAWLSLLGESGV